MSDIFVNAVDRLQWMKNSASLAFMSHRRIQQARNCMMMMMMMMTTTTTTTTTTTAAGGGGDDDDDDDDTYWGTVCLRLWRFQFHIVDSPCIGSSHCHFRMLKVLQERKRTQLS